MEYKGIFSLPASRKQQTSMYHKFIIFSSVLFLFIFVLGSVAFVVLMGHNLHENTGHELVRVLELERFKLEATVNSEIAIMRKMAASPLILRYFLNQNDAELEKMFLDDIDGYRWAFASNSLFWVNDTDKKFYMDGEYVYTIDPDDPEHYWYNRTLYQTERYNFDINYNQSLNITNLWINAPIFDSGRKPVGMVATGINLSDFTNVIYRNYSGIAELYFFNASGEITGAKKAELVANKVRLDAELGQTGEEILAGMRYLRRDEIRYFEAKDFNGVAAFGAIPALDWYVAAVHRFTIKDSLETGMTVLFGAMMLVVFCVLVAFNLFVAILLEPLNRITRTISHISSEWDLMPQGEALYKDEIGTLGDFLSMTIIDPLTGIYNRRFMDGNLKKMIKSLSRANRNLSLLMIDIDFFKNYNDAYGHDNGDKCLRKVADALTQCITRKDDFVARYGGEEFVVVLPDTDENGARLVSEKILNKVRECGIAHEKSDIAEFVTVSIGITSGVVEYSHNERDYIKCADKALYKSKNNGRNQYTFGSLEVLGYD